VNSPSTAPLNQTPPLVEYNLFTTDAALQAAVVREGAGAYVEQLARDGAALGTAANFEHARLANRHPPVLQNFNAQGERINAVEFHPSWHALMEGIAARGHHSGPWARGAGAGAHVARAAGYLMQAQIESGTLCPTTMTYGAIAALRRDAGLAAQWLPRLTSRRYDARDIPIASKHGGLIGMGMTEKQGGSDVRPIRHARIGAPMAATGSTATNGSSPRRNATRTSCSRRPIAACRASSCRAVCLTAR